MFYTADQVLNLIIAAPKNSKMIAWNNTYLHQWEYDILKKIGAINDEAILSDYPVLKVEIKEKDYEYDLGGDFYALQTKAQEIKASTKTATTKIVNVPRAYVNFINMKKLWRKQLDN